jgi:hypothetical protein
MIETTFTSVSFGVMPLENGGKQIGLIHPPSGQAWNLPLVPAAVDELVRMLGLSNEELQKENDLKEARAKLTGIDLPPGVDGDLRADGQ